MFSYDMFNTLMDSISSFLSHGANIILFMIVLPLIWGIIGWLLKKNYLLQLAVVVLSSTINILFALSLYLSKGFYVTFPFASSGLDIAFNIYKFSALFLMFIAIGFFLVTLYGTAFLRNEKHAGIFLLYMYISLAILNGAILSDNLGVMLFFWEGLLCTLFGMLVTNNEQKPRAAVKALVLSGTADLLLMLGIIITVYRAGTPFISQMGKLSITGVSTVGFMCMMLGAIGKAGCMPFHSWIPVAAGDAPVPFMVAFPGAIEKLLGIYLAVRIVIDIYDFRSGSISSIVIMVIGTLTIIFAVAMALIQKDMKRLLSYHAISQVGYMVLGIGTALPIGIIGGLFHMLNNAIYKSCLFMTAGSIEKQTGTTDLKKVGGLGKRMPITMICFMISGFAIAGLPPFNGFFSKELIFDAALESHLIFYLGALLGAFMTAVSFLKMGRAAFSGPLKFPENSPGKLASGKNGFHESNISVRESDIGMLLPMVIMAFLSIIFGIINTLPLDKLLGSALGYNKTYSGWPHSMLLVVVSFIILGLALLDHIYGYRKTGSAINAADHIHYAPLLKNIYNAAEKQWFDPYNHLMYVVNGFSTFCTLVERSISWVYDYGAVKIVEGAGNLLHRLNNGSLSRYLFAAVAGVAGIVVIFLVVLL
ncbi:MAG TPA: NADH-quinone oxidoreductase subunit L [Clostridiaceae bacterium]|nr:NADH-quinone oxidoreductase subunit L [Clostridiaceae bacterium]